MPKENINSDLIDDTGKAVTRAELSWKADPGWVQITTSMQSSGTVDVPDGYETGAYVQLNREACNRLIRALRKARDAAYGADA